MNGLNDMEAEQEGTLRGSDQKNEGAGMGSVWSGGRVGKVGSLEEDREGEEDESVCGRRCESDRNLNRELVGMVRMRERG